MNESVRVDAWIKQTLTADTGAGGLFDPATAVGQGARVSGVWSEKIPPAELLPAIRMSDLSPSDVNSVNGYRILVVGVFLVAVVGRTDDWGDLVAAADRLDTLLHRATGSFDGVTIESCVRQSPFRLPEDDGDVHYRHLGGTYRVQVST